MTAGDFGRQTALSRFTMFPDRIGNQHSADRAPNNKRVVLFAEDEPLLRQVASAMLERQGFLVLTACRADEALSLSRSRSGRIDLLLTDLRLGGGMDGIELALQVRRERPDLPVLI